MAITTGSEPVVKPSRKGIWGWMLFDWAAQPFFTVVTTFIFGPYFVARLATDETVGQAYWAYGVAASGFIIAILSPILGAIADQTGPRKPWIAAFALVKIAALIALWWAAPGSSLLWVVTIFTIATVAAEFSTVFNDSMMSRIVGTNEIGRVSNIAWGLGYLGGMIVLIFVVLALAGNPETGKTIAGITPLFGIDVAAGEDARITGPIAAIWYLVFILPMFMFTPDAGPSKPAREAIGSGIAELRDTIGEVRRRPGLFKFLVARMVYQDGVNALLALGAPFAAGMFAWQTTEMGIYGIILNIVAIFGCILAGSLDTRYGSKTIVFWSIILLLIATFGIISTGPGYTLFGMLPLSTEDSGGLFGTPAEKAYILYGLLIGFAFGPVQASSRSYMARSVAPHETGRYFGIYALAGRATSFLAPFLVATITALSGSARLGMAMIVPFFVIGAYILLTTPYPADRDSRK
jgi:MFS transporter, UMF1 family